MRRKEERNVFGWAAPKTFLAGERGYFPVCVIEGGVCRGRGGGGQTDRQIPYPKSCDLRGVPSYHLPVLQQQGRNGLR